MKSMYNVLADQALPSIRAAIIADQDVMSLPIVKNFEPSEVDKLKVKALKALGDEERMKAAKMLREGSTPEEVLEAVNTRYYPEGDLVMQITKFQELKKHNSGGGRILRLGGGVALLVVFGLLWVFANRIFYMLPIIALGMIGSSFITKSE